MKKLKTLLANQKVQFIISTLKTGKPYTVSELVEIVFKGYQGKQPRTSQLLMGLRKYKIVHSKIDLNRRIYFLNRGNLEKIYNFLSDTDEKFNELIESLENE